MILMSQFTIVFSLQSQILRTSFSNLQNPLLNTICLWWPRNPKEIEPVQSAKRLTLYTNFLLISPGTAWDNLFNLSVEFFKFIRISLWKNMFILSWESWERKTQSKSTYKVRVPCELPSVDRIAVSFPFYFTTWLVQLSRCRLSNRPGTLRRSPSN